MTSSAAARDIPILVTSSTTSSERRVNPSWTITQFKAKLEPITGIAPWLQTLTLRLPGRSEGTILSAKDEDLTQLASWSLSPYAELHVTSTDPSTASAIPPPSAVPKYEMPVETYSSLPDTVLAYKKSHQIGRFDPHAPEAKEKKVADMWREIDAGKINVGARCILPPSTTRRGTVAYVGLIPELPGIGPWIGVRLDEPAGKNDGHVSGTRYFDCETQYGVFVRPDRVEIGDWKELGLEEDDDPDEI
ncbi:MAG: hypothetical protein Q9220_003056 [cf. Caloplaca sp. 1 TL-2023]